MSVFDKMIIDSGEIRLNWSPTYDGTTLAATRGGNVFTLEQEIRDMAVAGTRGPVKGGRRMTTVTAKLKMNVIEWDTTTIKMSLPGSSSDSTTYDGYTMLHRALQIVNSSYTDSITLLGELAGKSKPVAITLDNALATGNFEAPLTDKDEAVNKLEVTAHQAPNDIAVEPWHIYFPRSDVPPLPTSVYYITSSIAEKLLKSTDLTSFYLVDVDLGTITIIDCICKANGLYVASSNVGDLYSSTDGIIWSLRLLTSSPDPYILWRQIIWSTLLSKFVAIGDLGFGNYGAVALSSDGIVWNLLDTAFPEGQYKVLEFDGMLVSVGWKRTAYTSTDGVVWTQRMTNYSSYNSSVIHDALNSRLIAMPVDSPYFYTSADGLSWEQVATIDYPGLYNVDIAMVGNVYYVASFTGIKKSTNLSTWEDVDLGAAPSDYYMMFNFNFVNGDLYACGASYDEDRSLVFKLVGSEFVEIPSDGGKQAGYMA